MGLDIVEFVMEIEDRFNIRIQDRDAERLQTVGQLIDYLQELLHAVPMHPCPTQQAFHRVRRLFLRRQWGKREVIRPSTSLEALIPREGRQLHWDGLGADLGVETLPQMVLSHEVLVRVFASAWAAADVVLWTSWGPLSLQLAFLLAAVVFLTVTWLLVREAQPHAIEFNVRCSQVGQLTRLVAGSVPPPIVHGVTCWTRDHIAAALHVIVTSHFGITDYGEETRFSDI